MFLRTVFPRLCLNFFLFSQANLYFVRKLNTPKMYDDVFVCNVDCQEREWERKIKGNRQNAKKLRKNFQCTALIQGNTSTITERNENNFRNECTHAHNANRRYIVTHIPEWVRVHELPVIYLVTACFRLANEFSFEKISSTGWTVECSCRWLYYKYYSNWFRLSCDPSKSIKINDFLYLFGAASENGNCHMDFQFEFGLMSKLAKLIVRIRLESHKSQLHPI